MYGEVKNPKKLRSRNCIQLRTPASENVELANTAGVAIGVTSSRRPVGVSDYTRAKAISHEYDSLICDEGLHSLVAVPVIVSRSLKGVLYAGIHSRARLGDKVLEEVTMTARCLEQELAINEAMRERAS